MAYNQSTGVISQPVSIYDVERALGVASGDLGTLCKHTNINKFSRHKPVGYASIGPIGFGYGTESNEAKTVNFGITYPDVVYGSGTTLAQKAAYIQDASANDWDYTPPAGGMSQPFRLTDFNEYYHEAVPPIQVVYPYDGWQFVLGSGNHMFVRIDLDPNEQLYNLQATDIINPSFLDLKNAKAVMCILYQSTVMAVLSTSDTLLDSDGNINDNIIDVNVAQIFSGYSGTFTADVYMAIQVGNYYYPFPKQGNYNPSHMYLKFIDDPKQSGGGVADAENDVSVSPLYTTGFKTLAQCADNFGSATYAMVSQGSLLIKMKLTNTSNTAKTVTRSDFTVDISNLVGRTPTNMRDTNNSVISSLTIPANGNATAIFYFDALFTDAISNFINWTNVSQETLFFRRNGATLVDFDLNLKYGTDGWILY